MPGKYPTINSVLTTRTILTAGGTDGLSNSDKNSLNQMFPKSPIYILEADEYRNSVAKYYLQPKIQKGDADQFPEVKMDYSEAPDLQTPPAGFDTSYYPNLIAAQDPAGGEGTATGVPLSPNDNFGTGSPVTTVTPAATSNLISKQTFGTVPTMDGKFNPSLGTDGTQSVNPGATGQTGAS
jgi:hypothetical protein